MEFLQDRQERNLIINLLGTNLTPKDIALALSRDNRTINKCIERWQQTGELNTGIHTGRPRITTTDEDLQINLHAIQNLFITCADIKN